MYKVPCCFRFLTSRSYGEAVVKVRFDWLKGLDLAQLKTRWRPLNAVPIVLGRDPPSKTPILKYAAPSSWISQTVLSFWTINVQNGDDSFLDRPRLPLIYILSQYCVYFSRDCAPKDI